MILPSDFALPDGPYLVGLLVGVAIAIAVLYRRRPPVTAATVTALAPWMAAGGTLYALYQAGTPPEYVAPLLSSPAVYATVGILAAFMWASVADRPSDTWGSEGAAAPLAGSGTILLLAALFAAAAGPTPRAVGAHPLVSVGIFVASIAVAAVTWAIVSRLADVSATGTVGALVVFGHTLDGISTAVGYDLLGFGEQTPLSRLIIETGGALPTAELIGAAWLFVLVKILLGAVVVVLFESYVREEPVEGYLLLGLILAVGLGPGFHNLVLFAIL